MRLRFGEIYQDRITKINYNLSSIGIHEAHFVSVPSTIIPTHYMGIPYDELDIKFVSNIINKGHHRTNIFKK